MINQAFSDAALINEKSFFGAWHGNECKLLTRGAGTISVAQKYVLEDDKSGFYYLHFNDDYYVAEIELRTSQYNVLGIKPGDSLASARSVLEQEGFAENKDTYSPSYLGPCTVYSKGYIIIRMYTGTPEDTAEIKYIAIKAVDPSPENTIIN